MEKFKSILSSRTIITNILTAAASIGAVWGFDMTAEQIATVVTVIVGIGTFASSFFRVQADKQLVSTPAKAEEANLRANASMQVAESIGRPKPPPSMPLVALLFGLLLMGCNQTTKPTVPVTPVVTVPPPTNVVDSTIDKARVEISRYCGAINIGIGFLETGIRFLKPDQLKIVQQASAGVEAYCENPPSDVATALEFLAETYRRVLALQRAKAAKRSMARALTI